VSRAGAESPQVAAGTRALLLAGGEGTRLRPLTLTTPKCLVPVRGKPLLGIWFDMLFGAGVERALVNTFYLPDQVTAFCRSSPWSSRIDLVHEQALLGTAGTLRVNAGYFARGPFLLAHADNLSRFSVGAFFAAHARRPEECLGTMMTFTAERPKDCGIVAVDDRGVAVAIHEKVENPPGNLANAAVFVLEPAIFAALGAMPLATDFCRDIVPPLAGRWFTFHNSTYHRDIGSPESLARAQQEFKWIDQ
jgi:mannose-1-phosphate guanylyltransferase